MIQTIAKIITIVGLLLVIIGACSLDSNQFFWQIVGITALGFVLLFIGCTMLNIF